MINIQFVLRKDKRTLCFKQCFNRFLIFYIIGNDRRWTIIGTIRTLNADFVIVVINCTTSADPHAFFR